jgi:signal peptidase I
MRNALLTLLVTAAILGSAVAALASRGDFTAPANGICEQTAAKVYGMPPAQTEAQALKQVQTDAVLFGQLTARLGALQPPKEIASGVGAMLAAFKETATALKQTSKAATAGDGAAAGAALKRAEKHEVQAQKLAYAVGLTVCAGDYRPGTKVYRIPSSSMEPTLHCARPGPGCETRAGDRVRTRALHGDEPKRFDIVVFRTPPAATAACGEGGLFIKRVVGLPGETVSERNGFVLVDGKPLKEPYISRSRRDTQSGSWRVTRGGYFVMGDNRAQSCDSRQWGSVPRRNVVGKVIEILRGSKVISPSSVHAAVSFVIRATAKRIDVGGYRIWDPGSRKGPTYAGALTAFGGARSCRFGHDRADAVVRWPALGVTAEFTTLGLISKGGNACTRPREVFLDHLTITGGRWTTTLGLRLGDPLSKLLRLYPRARRHGSSYWLITETNPAVGSQPLFAVGTRRGHVASFLFVVQAEGE